MAAVNMQFLQCRQLEGCSQNMIMRSSIFFLPFVVLDLLDLLKV